MTKKSVQFILGIVAAGLLCVCLFVYLIDPFYHYHKPLFGMQPYLFNTVYQTPGVARNFSYDSVILGTSMTENFRTSWFDDELGWNTVKLSYSGATTNDLAAILDQIFRDDRKVKNVLVDINEYQLTGDPQAVFAKRPSYLYDDNFVSDLQYLLNKDVVLASVGRVLARIQNTPGNMDTAYGWDAPELFGIKQVEKDYYNLRWQERNAVSPTQEEIQECLAGCVNNLDNIRPYIEAYPETKFYIFYPPYSMAYWQTVTEAGQLDKILQLYRQSVECLLPYENVALYYFQDEMDIVSDLIGYRDVCHYSPQVNRFIFECVKEDSHRLTLDNYSEKLDTMYRIAANYEYFTLWEAK